MKKLGAATVALVAMMCGATTTAFAEWSIVDDSIGVDGVAEAPSRDGVATLVVYCAEAALEAPVLALRTPARATLDLPDLTTIRLIGPEREVRDDNGDRRMVNDIAVIEGSVRKAGQYSLFIAEEATVGYYHPKLRVWPSFDVEIGRALYSFDGRNAQLMDRAIDACLHW